MVTRHEFLAELHELIKPKLYLEIGVQTGASLALAAHAEVAIGIDPHPSLLLEHERPNAQVFAMTSDAFFEKRWWLLPETIDLAFIDGSHLFEDALRDFINIERHCGPKSVVVFDDVLPYNQAIAERVQPPGDWTGDVWKVWPILLDYRDDDLAIFAVDTQPTGSLVVMQFEDHDAAYELEHAYGKIVSDWSVDGADTVPGWVLRRDSVINVESALGLIREHICES